ncbi:MAG: winged helix-turn-helix domain-containing protein [Proteobacteria bacterium]|nr:winged helix-turn-helix domain-containing protein [Pseudomonadota bacterium]
MEPQVFDLLVYVVQNSDRVVSKDDLLQAVWGGRIVSESTLTTRINALRKALGDSGEEQRLIRTVARKGIRFVGTVQEAQADGTTPQKAQPEGTTPPLPLPDKPSIAVLPFQNLSGDPEQEYFCDGMVEEITTALSRFHWLFVIARNSSFTYKGRAVDVKQVGRELGVRYVMEGSVRKAEGRVRITGQLIDAMTGAHLWADKFDGDLKDIFELQDKVAVSVVGAIEPKLQAAEIERAKRKPASNLDAYDLYLRALPGFYAGTKNGMTTARDLLYRAIEVNPRYGAAYGRASMIPAWRTSQGFTDSREKERVEAVHLARAAIEYDRDDPEAMYLAGWSLVFWGADIDRGMNALERSIAMNPNCAHACLYYGSARNYVGDSDTAIEYLLQAQRMSPRDPMMYLLLGLLGSAHMFAGRFEKAVECAKQSLAEASHFTATYRTLAASYAHLGRADEARETVKQMLQLEPGYSLQRMSPGQGLAQHPRASIYIDGLRMAGVPE